ncbi:MAG: hypothetical protein AM324_006090 [Candidatus Thorarchaeota archaeon SMTZ1-83]
MLEEEVLDIKLQIPRRNDIESRMPMVARVIADGPYVNELIVTESPHSVLTVRRVSK